MPIAFLFGPQIVIPCTEIHTAAEIYEAVWLEPTALFFVFDFLSEIANNPEDKLNIM